MPLHTSSWVTMLGSPYIIEVSPRIPARLARLAELSNNLWYSWDRPTRELFARLHPELWEAVGHSPKAFLKRVDEYRLNEAVEDPVFLFNLNRILSAYDTYHSESVSPTAARKALDNQLVAYFCAEFGFHESLPIYSGGLGILAGDHCKAASDNHVPLVGVGLLYRQGYFAQTIDREGSQHATHSDSDFSALPIKPALGAAGTMLRVSVDLPGRRTEIRIWEVRAGHVTLFLLDTDVPENSDHDRAITYRLYGGDRTTRIEQEIVLGIGGVRALAAAGRSPTVWHMNEGHAAFMVLERMRLQVRAGLDFVSALEVTAASSVFTTHTAVEAGHDFFSADMITHYFDAYCREVGIERNTLLALGQTSARDDFNMTALAVRGSRFHNGVSLIHAGVTSHLLKEFWSEIPPRENPVRHVTNGVHVRTFLSLEWFDVFDRFLGPNWIRRLESSEPWSDIDQIPDHVFWSVHQYLKSRMLAALQYRVRVQHMRNQGSEAHLERVLRHTDPKNPNVLTIGFARRFATYKRATLLFQDLDWLRQIVSNPQRPVVFIFAGRAHPADVPGQDLIREIARIGQMREFEGKVLIVEGYDLRFARRLVTGVDVWLNNPIFPHEASGTSGMKAGMNGVINLSVLDGWWGEGYRRGNGWAIKPVPDKYEAERRDSEEARELYEILQDQVLPLYYGQGHASGSPEWIRMAKNSMATILPRFNATRMVTEYVSKFYVPAAARGQRFSQTQLDNARELASWKGRIREAWPKVRLWRVDPPQASITFGDRMAVDVDVDLGGL